MNSELNDMIKELINLRDELLTANGDLKSEYDDLTDISHSRTEEDYARMDVITKARKEITDRYDDLRKRLEKINNLNDQLKEVQEKWKNAVDSTEKEKYYEEGQEICSNIENEVIDAYNTYETLINEGIESIMPSNTPTKEKLTTRQKIALGISGVALLAALGFGVKMSVDIVNDMKKNNPNNSNGSSSSEPENNPNGSNQGQTNPENPVEEPTVRDIPELENSTLTKVSSIDEIPARANELLTFLDAIAPEHNYTIEDVTEYLKAKNTFSDEQSNVQEEVASKFSKVDNVNDTEAVLERASEIEDLYDELAPQYGVDTAYAADMFNHINGGVVQEASREEELDVIRTSEVLFNNEYLYAKDMRNKGESLREENETVIDYGIFFTDGSKAQKLATKLSKIRSAIITSPTSTEAEKYGKEFTELLMNSWYLNGYNNEISLYALKTSGQAAFLDKLFLNTADLVQANQSEDYNVTVINPLTGDEITLVEIIEQINEANCEVEMTADNGEKFTNYINKFSYDMEGMLKEAVYNKQTYEENFGKTLTNN